MRILTTAMVLASLSACAHAPAGKGADPRYLLDRACQPGQNIKSVRGSIWMKAQSKDASGQFPASIKVEAPDSLRMEVTNLLGATVGMITIKGTSYVIDTPKEKKKQMKGSGTWAGIPLRWAPDLFLGRIPCPTTQAMQHAELTVSDEGELTVQIAKSAGDEKFVYRFRDWAGSPWVESVHWEKKEANVDFKFDDPDQVDNSPQKFEARSPQGEVKIRWKDREVSR